MHTAEGARTIESLGSFFQNRNNSVSSHVGADDKRGIIGEYVSRGNAAWTQASYNSASLSMELCGFASWTRDVWLNQHSNMLRNAADWIAEECARHNIPITRLTAAQAQGSGRGVCMHIDLGAGGGGHVDCGSGFPFDQVLEWARSGYKPPTPPPAPEVGENMIYLQFDQGGSAGLVFANEEADGKHRVRLFCSRDCKVELDLRSETATYNLGYSAGPNGMKIPKDVKCGVVRMLTPPAQGASVAFVVSESG